MRVVFLVVVLAGLAAPSVQGREQPEAAERTPLILLDEMTQGEPPALSTTRWALNFLNPMFVLYKDGLVIFKKARGSSESCSAQLTPEQVNALLEGLNVEAFLALEEEYYTNNQFHQPLAIITYWQDHAMKRVMVSGPIRERAEDRNKTPHAFLRIFDRVTSFHHENAQLWEPEKLEIRVIPYTDSKGAPVAWPKDWVVTHFDPYMQVDRPSTFGHNSMHEALKQDAKRPQPASRRGSAALYRGCQKTASSFTSRRLLSSDWAFGRIERWQSARPKIVG